MGEEGDSTTTLWKEGERITTHLFSGNKEVEKGCLTTRVGRSGFFLFFSKRDCEIVRTTVHRVSVVTYKDQNLSFGVLICVGPEQDRKGFHGFAPSEWTSMCVRGEKTSPSLEVCWIVALPAVIPIAVSGRKPASSL